MEKLRPINEIKIPSKKVYSDMKTKEYIENNMKGDTFKQIFKVSDTLMGKTFTIPPMKQKLSGVNLKVIGTALKGNGWMIVVEEELTKKKFAIPRWAVNDYLQS